MVANLDNLRQRQDCVSCAYGDGIAILDLVSNTYFSLNDVGALVWEKIGSGATLETVLAAVTSQYEIATETCEPDIRALIADLLANNLVKVN